MPKSKLPGNARGNVDRRRKAASSSSSLTAKSPNSDSLSRKKQTKRERTVKSPKLIAGMRVVFSRYKNVPGWTPNPISALIALLVVRIIGALRSPIADCDETYNYWEPLHYLVFGYGFQTWEYVPRFALRSWTFLLPYAGVAQAAMQFSPGDKVYAFYFVRVFQAAISAFAELYFYDSVVWRFGKDIGRLLLVFLIASPGLFRASAELLPSSFAMISLTAAYAAWMVGNFTQAIALVATSALLGWVYVLPIAIPIALHIIYRKSFAWFLRRALISGAIILGVMLPIDAYFYGKPVIVPLAHLLYNVTPSADSGPTIFGTEPLIYYVINLFLNLPITSLLAAAFPLFSLLDCLGIPVWPKASGAHRGSRNFFLWGPFLFLGALFRIPHKEERFLAPAYPMLCLCAAVAFIDFMDFLFKRRETERRASSLALAATTVIAGLAITLGVSRAYLTVKAYEAPFRVMNELWRVELQQGRGPRQSSSFMQQSDAEVNICFGKEWYRFPGHFFLPEKRFRVRFVREGFNGILPKYFSEDVALGSREGSLSANGLNKEDPGQFFEPGENGRGCHYLIDNLLGENDQADADYVSIPSGKGVKIFEHRFLDNARSPPGLRAFYIPQLADTLVFGRYVIIRNTALLPFVNE